MILFNLAVGFAAGIVSGMGIGGGTILIPALVFISGIEQQSAQNVNLIYFIPTALVALITHLKNGNVEKKVLTPLIAFGIVGAVAGSLIAIYMSGGILRRIFGFFLLIMGVYEFFRSVPESGEKK